MRGESASPVLARARSLLARWSEAAAQLPPHDLLDRIVHEGDLLARLAATVPPERVASAVDAVYALLGASLELDGARFSTPYNFVRALRQRSIKAQPAARKEAVQLLTIHGAKGLEAPVVFVMDSDPEPKNADTATLLIDWPVESVHTLLCAFVYSESQCPASLRPALEHEMAARRREELNGLYVAMSRARERLVFSATAPHRVPREPSWWQRIEAHAVAWLPDPSPVLPDALTADTVTVRCLPLWDAAGLARTPASEGAPMQAADDDSSASRLGKAVHRVLEWAAAPGRAAAVDFDALAAAAALEFAVAPAVVAQRAGRIWHSPACAPFFGGAALRWAGNEVPVSDAGELLRIDRLVELAGAGGSVWWVLDYKLQHAPQLLETYREQLQRYRRAVQRLQPGATVRCAFISGEGAVLEVE